MCEHCHSEIPSSGETFLANGDEIICEKCHGDGPSEKCPICHTNEVNYTTQGCNHQFCRQCITQWFGINRNCPMCRNSNVLDSIAYFSTDDDSSVVETIDKHRCTIDFLKENTLLMDKRKLLNMHCNCDRDCKRSIYTLCEHGGRDAFHEEVRRVFQWMAGNVYKAPMHPKCFEELTYLCVGGFCTNKYLLNNGSKEKMCAYCQYMTDVKKRYEKELKAYRVRLKKGKNTLVFQRCKVNISHMGVEFISTERKEELNSFSEKALVIQRFFRARKRARKIHRAVLDYVRENSAGTTMTIQEGVHPFPTEIYKLCEDGVGDCRKLLRPYLHHSLYSGIFWIYCVHCDKEAIYTIRKDRDMSQTMRFGWEWSEFYESGVEICPDCLKFFTYCQQCSCPFYPKHLKDGNCRPCSEKLAVETFVNKNGGWRADFFDFPDQVENRFLFYDFNDGHTLKINELCETLQRYTPKGLYWNWVECEDCYCSQLFLSKEGRHFALDGDWDSWNGDYYCFDCKLNYYRCETCDQWFLIDDSDMWDDDALENGVCKQCRKEEEPKAKRHCTRQ